MKRIMLNIATIAAACPAAAETTTIETQTMRFTSCLKYIQDVAEELNFTPENIVETSDARIVRFPTNDGSGLSILITCSKPDKKLIVLLSDGTD
ncbi:MAG: hypothetical protein ABJL33_15430 [Hyphomicrobiales bacterium]